MDEPDPLDAARGCAHGAVLAAVLIVGVVLVAMLVVLIGRI